MSPTATRKAPAVRRLVSLPEAAEFLAVSVKTVRRYIAAGELDAVRLGRRTIRIRIDSLDRIIDEQWVEPVSSIALVSGLALVALRHLSWSAAAASLRPDAADTRGDRSPSAPA